MSMFSNGNSKPATFANFNLKEGNFKIGKGDAIQSFSQVRDVNVVRASVKDDEYEGQPLRKLQLTVEKGDERSILTFNMASGVVGALVGKLLKADLNQPLGISAALRKAGSSHKRADGTMSEPLKNDMADLSLYQGGYVQLAEGERPPKVSVEKLASGKEVKDDTLRVQWIEAKVAELIAKLGSTPASNDHGTETKDPVPGPGFDDLGDDIPF